MFRPPFAVAFDDRGLFARTPPEHLVLALEEGANSDGSFLAFTLDQSHVGPGGLDHTITVWPSLDELMHTRIWR